MDEQPPQEHPDGEVRGWGLPEGRVLVDPHTERPASSFTDGQVRMGSRGGYEGLRACVRVRRSADNGGRSEPAGGREQNPLGPALDELSVRGRPDQCPWWPPPHTDTHDAHTARVFKKDSGEGGPGGQQERGVGWRGGEIGGGVRPAARLT